MQNGRIVWLDIAKGIAIVLMVIGHAAIPHSFADFIFAFHMPLFFMASGLTTNWNKHKIKDFCLHKTRVLLLPFALYSVFVLTIKLIIGDCDMKSWILMGWQGYALWFVPILFLSLVLTRMIVTIQNKSHIIVIAILMAVMGGYIKPFWHITAMDIKHRSLCDFLDCHGIYSKTICSKI